MSRVAVIGEGVRVQGFALGGALVLAAEDPAAVRAAWRTLPGDVAVVVLTPRAADALRHVTGPAGAGLSHTGLDNAGAAPDRLPRRPGVLPVVMPADASPDQPAAPS
jgi:hypothetical protein